MEHTPRNNKPLSILLVEDSESDAYILEDNLKQDRRGAYDVKHVTRLADGIEALDKRHYDLILLDLNLPDANGIETIVAMRKITKLPIVVLTGQDDAVLGLKAIQEGAQDYLEKNAVESFDIVKAVHYAIERHSIQQQVEYLAYNDSLTALPNRNLFFDRLSQAIKNAQRSKGVFSVFMIDLDGFKAINDTHGHSAGDLALVKTTDRLLKVVRTKDTFARIGGDEFAVLQTDIDNKDDALFLANRLKDAMKEPLDIMGKPCKIGLTIGIAYYPEHGENADVLMENADKALYVGKTGQKGTVNVYTPENNVTALKSKS